MNIQFGRSMANQARRIAFVSTMGGYPWGGSEELWCRTASRLNGMGHQVGASVYQWPNRPAQVTKLAADGVKLRLRPRRRSVAERLAAKVTQRLFPTPLPHGDMRWLRDMSPDLVVISQGMPWEGLEWLSACRRLGLRYCPIIHANSEHWWPVDTWRDDIVDGFPAAQRVFFVSHANWRLAEMQCGFPVANGEIVLNPCNVDASRSIPWPDNDGVTRIACVGRVDPAAKGQDLLMEVLAMPKWQQRPLHLNIYGTGPCERMLMGLQGSRGLHNVTFAGHQTDVAQIWADNHALVLPSRFEGLPLTIVEAMLCARPVITTDVAGNAQYLQDGVTGFVAAAPTAKLLDEAMERAWAARPMWQSMGAEARSDMLAAMPHDPIESFATRLLDLAST